MTQLKPFLKWAGGKSQLIGDISLRLPNYVANQDFCFVEPFFGGGAVGFWALSNFKNLKCLVINDFNKDLINVYQMVKTDVEGLISELKCLQLRYDQFPDKETKKPFYYEMRSLFNQRNQTDLIHASLFIFLNKAGFNGLYRVSKNNVFNVPIGSYARPKFLDEELLFNMSKALKDVTILSGDYADTLNYLPKNLPCFFYLDPPYRPISTTASFKSYSHEDFNDKEQERLNLFCKKIDKLGYQFLLSNSDPTNHNPDDDFFEVLYRGFSIERVKANRTISATSAGRVQISELLIKNY